MNGQVRFVLQPDGGAYVVVGIGQRMALPSTETAPGERLVLLEFHAMARATLFYNDASGFRRWLNGYHSYEREALVGEIRTLDCRNGQRLCRFSLPMRTGTIVALHRETFSIGTDCETVFATGKRLVEDALVMAVELDFNEEELWRHEPRN